MNDKVRRLVMMAGSSQRSLPQIFAIFQSDQDLQAYLASASGARWWLLRMGLYALREPLVQATGGLAAFALVEKAGLDTSGVVQKAVETTGQIRWRKKIIASGQTTSVGAPENDCGGVHFTS